MALVNDDASGPDEPLLVHLQPLGLLYGGDGTPLKESWVDLSQQSHVFYGLNGAGKTRLLEGLVGALTGFAAGGRILARIPFEDDHIANGLAWKLGEMLAGDEQALADDPTGPDPGSWTR